MYVLYIIVAAMLGLFGVFTYFYFWPDPAYRAYLGSPTDRHLTAVVGPEPEVQTVASPPSVWEPGVPTATRHGDPS
jgi:hypothetical protein